MAVKGKQSIGQIGITLIVQDVAEDDLAARWHAERARIRAERAAQQA
jgi:hypothetical protein